MNTELLLKVKAHILEEPKRLNMSTWVRTDEVGPDAPSCGTIACIAGWVCLLIDADFDRRRSYRVNAIRLLGITEEQADRLFYIEAWPSEFYLDYSNTFSFAKMAKVTAERIDYFINTKGD